MTAENVEGLSALSHTALATRLARHSRPAPETGCIEWTGSFGRNSYGRISWRGKHQYVHRLAWMARNGAIPVGMHVLHSCDNPSCINPDHLRLGTVRDNMVDRDTRGRQAKGVGNGKSKLTVELVQAIRADGRFYREIAVHYGIHKTTVQNIVSRKTWAHV